MFGEENNSDFTAETILGALLRTERARSQLFGNREQKKNTTLNGSSVPTKRYNSFRDNIEEQERNTTYSWHPAPSIHKKKFKSRTDGPEISTFLDGRMKNYNQTKKSSIISINSRHKAKD